MNIAFRVDASSEIGIGHFMRCLVLADAMHDRGINIRFVCRSLLPGLAELLQQRDYEYDKIGDDTRQEDSDHLAYSHWLGTTQEIDARQTLAALSDQPWQWVIVDHYALDTTWESEVGKSGAKLFVLDDLVNRNHQCQLLLDQTFGRTSEEYTPLVADDCELLLGCEYALLRPEFLQLREFSLARRTNVEVKNILITMGGSDLHNVTERVLQALVSTHLPVNSRITVVLGYHAPWLEHIRQMVATMRWQVDVKTHVENMAQLMAESDLAIGASGTTSWERCCLGLPSFIAVLADNQRDIASRLSMAGAVINLGSPDEDGFEQLLAEQLDRVISSPDTLNNMSKICAEIVDGKGSRRVLEHMGYV